MFLKPLALATCLVLPLGNAWAQEANTGAPSSSALNTGPAAGDARRAHEGRDTSKVGGPAASQGTTSKGMMDSAIGHGTGRADEDASAAVAR